MERHRQTGRMHLVGGISNTQILFQSRHTLLD